MKVIKSIPVRVIYTDMNSETVKMPIESLIKIMGGIEAKQSITLDGREVLEVHLISRYSYESCKRIEVSNNDSFNILYLKEK